MILLPVNHVYRDKEQRGATGQKKGKPHLQQRGKAEAEMFQMWPGEKVSSRRLHDEVFQV